jgi:peptidyl-prolyl cis-trans isomerase C
MLPWIVIRTRRLLVVAVALVAAVSVAGYVAVARTGDLPDGVAANVNGVSVTEAAVESRMRALEALYGVAKPTTEELRDSFPRDTAKSIVVEQLMQNAARDRGIVIAEKSVSDALATLIEQRYPEGGRRAFVAALGEMGASEQQVRDEIEQQMMVARLFDDVTKDVSVSEAEVRQAFLDRRASLRTGEQRLIRNIVVDTRQDAVAVLDALRSGASFATVAKRSSLDGATRDHGGLLGTVTADQLDKQYAASAFAAALGQPFGPVHTAHGWNVGLVERAFPAHAATFAAVSEQLKTSLQQEKWAAVWTDWLRELLANADVEYAPSYRPADQDGVPEVALPSNVAGGN